MKSCYKEMLLSKGYIVVNQITQREENVTDRKIAAIIKSFSSLGYALTKESLELLTKLSDGSLNYLYNENISTLRRAKGDESKLKAFRKIAEPFCNRWNIKFEDVPDFYEGLNTLVKKYGESFQTAVVGDHLNALS